MAKICINKNRRGRTPTWMCEALDLIPSSLSLEISSSPRRMGQGCRLSEKPSTDGLMARTLKARQMQHTLRRGQMKENKDLKSVGKGDSGVKGDFADPLKQNCHGCNG